MRIKLKKKQNKYAQVHIDLLRNRKLSLKAKGLGSVLESYSDDFDVSIKSIELNSSDGSKAIKTAIKELENGYYLYRFQTHDTDGKFITYWAFDSQKLEINYLKAMINELEKVDLITPNNLSVPGYRNGASVNNSTEVPFSADGFSTDGKTINGSSTTYKNISNKNKKDKNTLYINNDDDEREYFTFKKFKNYALLFTNIGFSLNNKLGYSEQHKGFCIKNEYIYSNHTQKLVDSDEAFKIWDYLYKNKQKFYEIMDQQKTGDIK